MKTSLVLLLTLTSLVFMYEGWYKPHVSHASQSVARYFQQNSGTSIGVDGTTNWASGTSIAKTLDLMDSTVHGSSSYTSATWTSSPTVVYQAYSPQITSNVTIDASAVVTVHAREATAVICTETFRANLYEYDPAGTAGNGTLIGTGGVDVTNLGTTTTAITITLNNPSYTLSASAGTPKRLRLNLVGTSTASANVRIYSGTGTASNLTTGETYPDILSASGNTTNTITSPQSVTGSGLVMQRFQVAANANSVELNSLTLDDLGTATSIGTAKVYIDTTASTTLPGSAVLIGSTTGWAGTSTAIPLNAGTQANRTVTSGTPKYIYIVYDLDGTQVTKTIQSSVTALGVVAPDTVATFSVMNSIPVTLTADTLTVGSNTPIATTSSDTASDVVMQRVNLVSDANGNSQVILSSITIDSNGTTATNYTTAKIYIDSTASTTLPGTAVLIGSQAPFSGASTTIALTGGTTTDRTVSTTPKYLYILYDMGSGQGGLTVQSRITAVGVAAPDFGATGLTLASNSFALTSTPVATIGNCGGCHFYSGVSRNLPRDGVARNNPAGLFPGSHGQHANTYGFACSVCHVVPATTTTASNNHSNGIVNMASPINGNPGAVYTKGTSFATNNTVFSPQNCTTTNCHGQKSPTWGTVGNANSCLKCHGDKSSTFINFSAANVAPGGNGVDTSGVNTTGSRVGLHQNHLTAKTGFTVGIHCGECHKTVTSVNQATHRRYTTASLAFGPMATGSLSGQSMVPTITRVNGTIQCTNVWCHTPLTTKRPSLGTGAGQLGITSSPVLSFTDTGWLDGTTINGTCLNKCHGLPPGGGVAGDKHAPRNASGYYSTAQSMQICASCHDAISDSATSMDNLFADKSLHIKGTAP